MLIDKQTGELFLYGEIFYGMHEGCIDSPMVIQALAEIKDMKVIARINSPGGLVDEGIAIKNALQRHPGGCEVIVDGIAASIASWIMLAGDTITFSSGTRAMLHSPLTVGFGWENARGLREIADVLDVHENSMLPEYARAMQITEDEVKAILDAETWYTAEQATEAFSNARLDVNATAQPIKIAAGLFKNTPNELIDKSIKSPVSMNRVAASIGHQIANVTETNPSNLGALKAYEDKQAIINARTKALN